MIFFILTIVSLCITYKVYGAFIEVKDASVRNKIIFIDEFKKIGYYNHPYTKKNYSEVKKWAESRYSQLEYLKSQDLFYASIMFKNPKNSKEYNQALKAKEDISKIYKEIEFDTIRECFKEIIKIDNLLDSNMKIKEDIYKTHEKLFKSMFNDVFFSKQVGKFTIYLAISSIATLLLIIGSIFSCINLLDSKSLYKIKKII